MTNSSPQSNTTAIQEHEGFLVVGENGYVLSANKKAKQLFKMADTDVHIADLFLEFEENALPDCSKGVLLQRYVTPLNGSPFPVFVVVQEWTDEKGKRYFVTVQNLEHRTVMDNGSYQHLKELLDIKYALDASSIVALTDRRGKIRYVNDKFSEISKYEINELIGSDHRILNSGYHSKEFFKNLWRTIGTGNVWKGEIQNRAKDGTYYWVDTTIVPFLNENGKPYQYLAIRNEITERKRVEQELKKMTQRLIHVQEEERKQVSRELHDGIGQELYSLLISMHRLQQEVDHPLIDHMTGDISHLIQSVRDMSWGLRPSALDELGLLPAIRSFLHRLDKSFGLKVEFHSAVSSRLTPTIETTIYRIVQEALTNVRKYAEIDQASVKLVEKENELSVYIMDEGVGFSETHARRGVGLFSMEERARAVGGDLTVESIPGKGTTIEMTVPKEI
ncbi:PAS domain-containing sensor histidine kinase [Halobacillus mangrovi]|uniref:Oxygen sensor histidine kinase NreB n=1 Tax=Halobacillus mangrovi TaxID=402384 RepID=A0A1W5ZR72_9BACI|nr:PAS domain-containing protein [Halobacillus mangrovi]ARI75789.1 histidine kinase [Halobacillus mangrovi]